jgi:adenine-specific DNA-methyltransferase
MAIDKNSLIEKLNTIEGLTNDERSALLGLLRSHKKYGLVWEDKPEDVEERLRSELPVLIQDKDLLIPSSAPDAPNHILIEGDNLEALTTLAYTHEGKIDVIYIDPPYNTGNNTTGAFYYNDEFIDSDNSFRHSKWLCFMKKRLTIAHKLLKNSGVIIISIDDNEQANLKLLCDEIFLESNFVGNLPTIMNLKGNQDEFGFAGTHEYTLVYAKNIGTCFMGQLNVDEEQLDDWLQDEIGFYKKGATLKRTGTDAPRERRPYCYFPILIDYKNKAVSCITAEEYKGIYNPIDKSFDDAYIDKLINKYNRLGYEAILPVVNGDKASWRWGYNTVCNDKHEIIVSGEINNISLYKKQRPELGDLPTKKPKSTLYRPQYSSGNGTAQLRDLNLDKKFNNPKPLELIMDLLQISSKKDSIILDFFAGSGTTLDAIMHLNSLDNGKRTGILVTNNESNICMDVTYERSRSIINGYTKPNGEIVSGLKNNRLRYYRTAFVSRARTPKNMRQLMSLATDMLCIKEDLYTEQKQFGELPTHPKVMRYFAKGDKSMLVIYYEPAIAEIVEQIEKLSPAEPIKVYVFSPSEDPWEEDFEFVSDKVELCALPAAIYNTYKRILPKKKDERVDIDVNAKEPEQPKGESTLFDLFEEGGEQ